MDSGSQGLWQFLDTTKELGKAFHKVAQNMQVGIVLAQRQSAREYIKLMDALQPTHAVLIGGPKDGTIIALRNANQEEVIDLPVAPPVHYVSQIDEKEIPLSMGLKRLRYKRMHRSKWVFPNHIKYEFIGEFE